MRARLATLFVLLTSSVFAQNAVDCENAMAQQDLNNCAHQEFEVADTDLNVTWKEARKVAADVDEEQSDNTLKGAVEALLAGQRGWIAYRDGICELAGFEARGGSMEPMLVSGCLAQKTIARTKELQEFINGPEQ